MRQSELTMVVAASIICATAMLMLVIVIPQIHQWERSNNYPYGKLCDVYHSCGGRS
jgi:hypothetical protein